MRRLACFDESGVLLATRYFGKLGQCDFNGVPLSPKLISFQQALALLSVSAQNPVLIVNSSH